MLNILKNLFCKESLNLREKMNDGAVLVDVRTPAEYADTKVKGSINIPLDRLNIQQNQLKNKKHIIVFCRSGLRSTKAKALLEASGFTNVVNAGTLLKVKKELELK